MRNNKFELNWEVGFCDSINNIPEEWIKADVPGAVQLDWAKAKNYPDYKIADNYKRLYWTEDKCWVYRSSFAIDNIDTSKKYFFISKGIDYEFEIHLNGKKIFYQEGMYRKVDIEITGFLKTDNEILVKIYPVPKVNSEVADRFQAAQSTKPAASYSWDWHPRLIPLGIWDDTFIEARNSVCLSDLVSEYILSDDLKKVEGSIKVTGNSLKNKTYELKIISPSDKEYIVAGSFNDNTFIINYEINNPELWNPIGYGRQNLYECELKVYYNGDIADRKSKRIGFRKTKLVMNEGTWDEPKTFPKTRSVPPIQLEVNNNKVFCKGSNWVMPEIFYGTITNERYKVLIDLAVDANFNIIRLWGGAIINKDFFYDYCDEKGILVWQEFPLACMDYYDSAKYLSVLESEASFIIEKIKQHPSLAFWCGGNELFNNWSGMTDQSKALRLLNKLCYEQDQNTPFISTSPLMGMGHGHYVFFDHEKNETVFDIYTKAKLTANTEFGIAAPSSVDTLQSIIPEDELWPPKSGTAWEDHHAFNSWVGDTWLSQNTIEKYYGKLNNINELADYGQTLQAIGLQFIFEELRRQRPYCSMALNWCFNDCWPSAANTSIIEYPCKPKQAYYSLKKACRPILASVRARKFVWKPDELFECDLFLLNDSLLDIKAGEMNIFIKTSESKNKVFEWKYADSEGNKNILGPTVRFNLPNNINTQFELIAEVENHPEYNSTYKFRLEQTNKENQKTLNQ
ncbi:MAG: hypothetical protein JEY94_01625 [Melioribacteraceae bacterium]|nr:hypothetical protein [Melioribacteraceae bacterium]